MKKIVVVVILFAAVAAGVVLVVWLKRAKPAEEEAPAATEVSVRVGKITRATLRGYVTAYGMVEAEPPGERPAASARVGSPVPGIVKEVYCAEGQRVQKGQLLAQLDSRVADVAADFAEKSLKRQKQLAQGDGTSQKALEEAQQQVDAAHAQQALLRIQAPLAGTVVRVNVTEGAAVDVTTVVAEVIDLDRLEISASVAGTELAALKTGQPTETLAGKTSAALEGKLTFISPDIDAKTGAATVRVALPTGSGLRPGQFVTLRIVSEEHKDCLAVPAESVVEDEEGGSVIALVQKDKAVRKQVKAGLRDKGLVEVEGEGLEAGMAVVTEGAYGLPKETKITVTGK